MKKTSSLSIALLLFSSIAIAQDITITVDANAPKKAISPYIYGRNNSLSDQPLNPNTATEWQFFRDVGVRIFRDNGGNNSTKYNWKKKLSSHPDWYNNVYAHDWDFAVQSLMANTPNTQALFALPLLGVVADTDQYNFNDWGYNGSAYWSGTSNNWAGGGGPKSVGGNDSFGNPTLYLRQISPDTAVGILSHWLEDLKIPANRMLYWNMDNEPEIWESTHDDVADSSISAEECIQKYVATARAARKAFPQIKLVGPVSTNEWQWYAWGNKKVRSPFDGKEYVWLEYFIKRIAEEQKKTGERLLDVLDVHFYPGTADNPDLTLQLHRIWFDRNWVYSGANGVKLTSPNGWDNSINKEYLFGRCEDWLKHYVGENHGVTFGVSESGALAKYGEEDANVIACWYASTLGTFAQNNVEIFTPWDWYAGQWEVLYLFSNFFGTQSIPSLSTNDSLVSAYSSFDATGDTVIIALVNRDRTTSHSTSIVLKNFDATGEPVTIRKLSKLPKGIETFDSKLNHASSTSTIDLAQAKNRLALPPLSLTLLTIPRKALSMEGSSEITTIYPNPAKDKLTVQSVEGDIVSISIFNLRGERVLFQSLQSTTTFDISSLAKGAYSVTIETNGGTTSKSFVKE